MIETPAVHNPLRQMRTALQRRCPGPDCPATTIRHQPTYWRRRAEGKNENALGRRERGLTTRSKDGWQLVTPRSSSTGNPATIGGEIDREERRKRLKSTDRRRRARRRTAGTVDRAKANAMKAQNNKACDFLVDTSNRGGERILFNDDRWRSDLPWTCQAGVRQPNLRRLRRSALPGRYRLRSLPALL